MEGRKICIAVDGSKHSENAFHWYAENFHRKEHQVLLVHVNESAKLSVITLIEGKADHYENIYKGLLKSEKILEKFKAKCVASNIKFTPFLVHQQGSIGQTICDIAESHDANVIVTGQRGLGKVNRTLLESTSDYVLHHAHVPVLVVPFKMAPKRNGALASIHLKK